MKKPNNILNHCNQCVYRKGVGWFADGYCTLHKKKTAAKDSCIHFSNIAKRGELKRLRQLLEAINEV